MSLSLRWPENLPTEVAPFTPFSPTSPKTESDAPLFADLAGPMDHNVLVGVLQGMLNNQRTRDVEIVVGGKTIFAHSPILTSRSPYFRNLIETGFREHPGDILRIEVTDFSYDVMYAFNTYIYTNRMVSTVPPKDLFLVADKYEVLPLRDLAEQAIIDGLTVDGVCEQLFQYGHRFPTLRSKMIHFIATHFRQIDQRCDLADLIQDYKHQMEDGDLIFVEVMRAMSKNLYSAPPSSSSTSSISSFTSSSSSSSSTSSLSSSPTSSPSPRFSSGIPFPSSLSFPSSISIPPSIPIPSKISIPSAPLQQQSNPAGGFYFGFDLSPREGRCV